MLDLTNFLEDFSNRFVRKEFRHRFVHEAIKKPAALHRRICHEIERVFDKRFKNQVITLHPSDECLFLGWSWHFELMKWKEIEAIIGGGGGGYLVIKIDGSAFYAETEAYPALVYAGTFQSNT